jgi:hypothetical protein
MRTMETEIHVLRAVARYRMTEHNENTGIEPRIKHVNKLIKNYRNKALKPNPEAAVSI